MPFLLVFRLLPLSFSTASWCPGVGKCRALWAASGVRSGRRGAGLQCYSHIIPVWGVERLGRAYSVSVRARVSFEGLVGLGWVGNYNHEVLWCTSPVLTGTLTQSKASQLSQGHEGFESIGGKRLIIKQKENIPQQQH